MKKTTKILLSSMVAVLVMAAPLAAQAGPGGSGRHGGPHYGQMGGDGPQMMHRGGWFQALAPEKQAAVSALFDEHRTKMEPIREQLWIKRTTLDALSANPNTEPKKIEALVTEMAGLRKQLYTERKALADRVEKETGFRMPYGKGGGFGYGHRGRHHKGGYGKGHGW
ncbi:MAG: hypothetical protein DELT_00028 [Desulfovibrio sp.]